MTALAQARLRRPRGRGFLLWGAGLLLVLAAVAIAAPLLAPYDPAVRVGRPFSPPTSVHLLGTNDVGQDLLSELLYGARVSLLVGGVAALVAMLIGTVVGVVAGYARGWVDVAAMRLVDVVLCLPVLPLTIVIGVFLGPGLSTQIVVIASVMWAGVARELRAQVLSVREQDHVQAVRAMGAGPGYALRRHVLRAVVPLVVPQFVLAIKTAILLEASLAFLGLGDITAKSWGTMLYFAHARSAFLTDAWLWWVVPPGTAIAATVLGFALLGCAFEERARPVLRGLPRPGIQRRLLLARGWPRRAAPQRPPTDQAAAGEDAGDAGDVVELVAFDDVSIAYPSADGSPVLAVRDVSLTITAGEVVGLVGESGSGKSTLAAAASALLPEAAAITAGHVRVCGRDLKRMTPVQMRRLRGARVALIPQEAMSALNPVQSIGHQLVEAIRAHDRVPRGQARRRAGELLELVGVAADRAGDHPHQLSGGMRQRVVIAIALANSPALLVADEPTSGLDVLVQAEVLDLLAELGRRLDVAMLVVSHDLPVLERIADRIAVMHAGRVVEVGPTAAVVTTPEHEYTRELLAAVRRLQLAGQPVAT